MLYSSVEKKKKSFKREFYLRINFDNTPFYKLIGIHYHYHYLCLTLLQPDYIIFIYVL